GASGGAAQGVPGALSNQPPPAPTAPIAGGTGAVAGAAPAATQQAQSAVRRDSTVNYEVDKTVRHVRTSTGAIRRLSAAVFVNSRTPAAAEAAKGEPKKGKGAKDAPPPRPTALGQEEMQQITALVKEAIGFSQQRGDSLSVSNVPFSADPPEVAPEPSFWNEPGTIAFAKETGRNLLIAGLALYLFLGVLRPLLRQLAQARPALPQEPSVPPQLAGPGGRYEDNLQALRQIARDDPRRVAGVLRTWVKEEAGADG
ncbi:MAG: flagellar basal body M-ring protein FliF, partial [Burkholderiales bacterium]|nr:flagellar basal body M-ring protein FliF [Burkholderiales bacterium]